jgi:hypothetical protein
MLSFGVNYDFRYNHAKFTIIRPKIFFFAFFKLHSLQLPKHQIKKLKKCKWYSLKSVFIKNEQFSLIYIKKFKLSWDNVKNVTKNNFPELIFR